MCPKQTSDTIDLPAKYCDHADTVQYLKIYYTGLDGLEGVVNISQSKYPIARSSCLDFSISPIYASKDSCYLIALP